MTSTRELLLEIDSALSTADESRTEQLRLLADRFESASARLTDKVSKCDSLWRQGRFDEARQAARKGEELRDQAELARFKSADSWSGWCRRLSMPIAPTVDQAKLGALLDQLGAPPTRFEGLLREYRRMALGRAPLIDRLRMLRAVAKADAENPAWLDDVRAFEQARHEELGKLLREAEKRGDLAQLRALRAELVNDPWISPPPPRLLHSAEAALAPLEVRATEARYLALAEPLRAAHGALDETRSRKLVEEWEALAAATKVNPPAACAADLQPVRAWLKDLDDQRASDRTFEVACAALESALDSVADLETIERLTGAVLRLERGIPPVLSARTASRIDELRRGKSRGYVLKLVGIITAAVLVGGVVAVSWAHHTRRLEVARWSDQVRQALDGGDVSAATRLLASVEREDPDAFHAPELQDLRARALARDQEETDRATSFNSAIATLESAGVAHLDFDAMRKRAEALAKTAPERALVEEWGHRRVVHLDEAQRFRDQALVPELDRLVRDHEALREANARDAVDVEERAAACLELARRLAGAADASPRLRERAASIAAATETLLEQALTRDARQRDVAAAIQRIQRTIDPQALSDALHAFARAYPDHPRSTEFVRAASQLEAWRAIEAWRPLIVGMGRTFRVDTKAEAAERRKVVAAYQSAHPRSPHHADAYRLLTYFERAEEALDETGLRGLDVVRTILDSPLVSASFEVEDRTGRRYYLLDDKLVEQPRRPAAAGVWTFDHVINGRLTTRKKNWNATTEGLEATVRRSSQSRFAELALRLLASQTEGRWETLYLKLIDAARTQTAMDPVLTASVIRLFIELGEATIPFVAEDLGSLGRELGTLKLDVPWMDPESEEAVPVRNRARGALDRFAGTQALVTALEARLTAPAILLPAGVYLRDVTIADPARRGELFAVVGDTPELRRIGRVANGVIESDGSALTLVTPGSLVFVAIE